MGTPSGSKNAAVFEDRLQLVGQRDFESGVVDASCEEAMNKAGCFDVSAGGAYSLAAERRQKASEEQEFRQAKSGVRIEQKMNFLEKIVPKAKPKVEGPAGPEKRKLPTFVKLKSKETQENGEEAAEQPAAKQQKAAAADSGGAPPLRSPESSDAASPTSGGGGGGGGLVAYGSDDEDSGSDE